MSKRFTAEQIIENYPFNFFEYAIAGFIKDFQNKMTVLKKMPVYFFQNGDEAFLLDWQRENTGSVFVKTGEITQSKPRIELALDAFTSLADQLTNPYVKGRFVETINGRDIAFKANVKRFAIDFPIRVRLVCDNVFKALSYSEMLLILLGRMNSYYFIHAKKRHIGAYEISDNIQQESNISLAFDAESRNRNLDVTVTLSLQFPAFDIINKNGVTECDEGLFTGFNSNIKNPDGEDLGNTGVDDPNNPDNPINPEIPDDPNNPEPTPGDPIIIPGGPITPKDPDDPSSDELVGNVEAPWPSQRLENIREKTEKNFYNTEQGPTEWPK